MVLRISLWILLVLAIAGPTRAADLAIYGDGLSTSWANWSWSATTNFASASPVHSGSQALAVTLNAGWAGLYFHASQPVPTSGYNRLQFWIHGGATGEQRLRFTANAGGEVVVTPVANGWTQVVVPLTELGNPTSLTDLYWQDASGSPAPTFFLDDISLLAGDPPPPVGGPVLSVAAGAARQAINPDIYGINFAAETLARELRLPVRRFGGNATTRYNWRLDVHNTAMDWYFENITRPNPTAAALPHGSASDDFVEQDRRTATRSLLTVPLIGWTPKQRLDSGHDCGFKVAKYGAQQAVDPWDTTCGNGLTTGGAAITGNAPQDTSVAIDPSFVSDWLAHLKAKYGSAANGGVAYYNLDNEPMLWNSTHRDVHPTPVTYDEIRDRTYQYAAAIKAADPTAKTLGPVLWGWCAYFYSARDGCQPGSDYQSHGNTHFVPWYLAQMRAYEQQHGQRILDYLDLHYYPQGAAVALQPSGNAATQALRLRSTRSLWDPGYVDESWIGEPVRLIPRMRQWVDTHYPGTKLALTEYNFGGLEGINGALAQADVLGIFGREGLDLSTLWAPPEATAPGMFAFRMFRNYDGAGHGFGQTSLAATTTDQDRLAIYAAQRSEDQALTLMVINKSREAYTSPLQLTGVAVRPTVQVWRYSAAQPGAIVRQPDGLATSHGLTLTYPAESMSLLILAPRPVASLPLGLLLGS